jgi:hypothetical protein
MTEVTGSPPSAEAPPGASTTAFGGRPSARLSAAARDRLVVVVVAALIRALYLWERHASASFVLPIVDSEVFDATARAFVDGRASTSSDWFFHGVGYPSILSFLYWIFGASIIAAKAVQLAFGVVTAVLTYELGRRVFDRTVGLAAGVIVAASAPPVSFGLRT